MITRHRTGCQLARLNRGVRERNRAEVWDIVGLAVAVALVFALQLGLAAVFSK